MPVPHRSPALPAIECLDAEACRQVLSRNRLCTMSMVDGTEPYAVPLFYGFDGETIYLGLAEGRKTAVLDRNPVICLVVVETGALDEWVSVQATGPSAFLASDQRDSGIRVLMEHNQRIRSITAPTGDAVVPSPATRRPGGGRILCLRDPILSGRIRR